MEINASLRNVRLSAQKGRLMADVVRGKPVARAIEQLAFMPQKSARILKKLIESAVANAEHNAGLDIDVLWIRRICVERGTFLRRVTQRAKGRGARILKPTCHFYVTLDDAHHRLGRK